jgi:ankyrin repeat protein
MIPVEEEKDENMEVLRIGNNIPSAAADDDTILPSTRTTTSPVLSPYEWLPKEDHYSSTSNTITTTTAAAAAAAAVTIPTSVSSSASSSSSSSSWNHSHSVVLQQVMMANEEEKEEAEEADSHGRIPKKKRLRENSSTSTTTRTTAVIRTGKVSSAQQEDASTSPRERSTLLLPYASSSPLHDYFLPGGTMLYRPRPEWFMMMDRVDLPPPLTSGASRTEHQQSSCSSSSSSSRSGSPKEEPVVEDPNDDDDAHQPSFPNQIVDAAVTGRFVLSSLVDTDSMPPSSSSSLHAPPERTTPAYHSGKKKKKPTTARATRFGKHRDTILLWAIQEHATEAACAMIQLEHQAMVTWLHNHHNDHDHHDHSGVDQKSNKKKKPTTTTSTTENYYDIHCGSSSIHMRRYQVLLHRSLMEATNDKGITPIILASQKGNITVVRALLRIHVHPASVAHDGTTALLQASHFGHVDIMKELLQYMASTTVGSSSFLSSLAMMTPSQFTELSNTNHTTPLMRAAQEGHVAGVQLLLRYGACVNRQNRVQMTALMLASQRGHDRICSLLIQAGAVLDHTTHQDSTALLLACKRGHAAVVRVLVAAGCELYHTDSRGRTIQQIMERRIQTAMLLRRRDGVPVPMADTNHHHDNNDDDDRAVPVEEGDGTAGISIRTNQLIRSYLDPLIQIELMLHASRIERNYEIVRCYTLLQQKRMNIVITTPRLPPLTFSSCHVHHPTMTTAMEDSCMVDVHAMVQLYNSHHDMNCAELRISSTPPPPQPVEPLPPHCRELPYDLIYSSTEALIRAMTLPAPLLEMIALFMPLPKLWTKRIAMLQSTCFVNANAGIVNALDLIDEVLEEGGFLSACDLAQVPPPLPYRTWLDWKQSATSCSTTQQSGAVSSSLLTANPTRRPPVRRRLNVTEAMPPVPRDVHHPTMHELRRQVGYLPLLAKYQAPTNLIPILLEAPYRMPVGMVQQLIRTADVASICRRCCCCPNNQTNSSSSSSSSNAVLHFEANAAMDIIMLASRLCSWYWRERHHLDDVGDKRRLLARHYTNRSSSATATTIATNPRSSHESILALYHQQQSPPIRVPQVTFLT